MRKTIFWPLAFLSLTTATVGLWSARQEEEAIPPTSWSRPQPVVASKHYVTPAQLTATAALVAAPFPPFSATAHDGRVFVQVDRNWVEVSSRHHRRKRRCGIPAFRPAEVSI